jgi:hypothetical protein
MASIYGCPATLGGSPIGGGVGYLGSINPSQARYVVSNAAELKLALASATADQIVYVADGVVISTPPTDQWAYFNLRSQSRVWDVPAGAILAGGRGRPGVTPGILQHTFDPYATTAEHGSRFISCGQQSKVYGLVCVGMQEGTEHVDCWGGIAGGANGDIANNEIHGWGYFGAAAFYVSNLWIHHNHIHHCQREGYGYPTSVHQGSALVEGNKYDWSRHVIAASRGVPTSNYEFCYNQLGANCTNAQIDCHGGNDISDPTSPAGGTLRIHHNTSIHLVAPNGSPQPLVSIRGIPLNICEVHHNWAYITTGAMVGEDMRNLPQGYRATIADPRWVNMEVDENWWGSTPPPDDVLKTMRVNVETYRL